MGGLQTVPQEPEKRVVPNTATYGRMPQEKMKLKHSDGQCDGEIKAVNETYGKGKPQIEFECTKCGQHLGNLPDCKVEDDLEDLF